MASPNHPTFNKAFHVKYWLRCLKTHLPTQYTSNDSQRTTLAFFILSALDLLGVLHEHTTATERASYVDWIYRCQHPHGGFRGFTGADIGDANENGEKCWDPANLAATYFSLAALAILGDNMERVKRRECLRWIRRLQLEDGSFGEAVGKDGVLEGGRDGRYCYCATAVRWMLRVGMSNEEDDVEDINIEALARFIISSQSYEGGIAKAPLHEANAGWTYCGISTLALLEKLPSPRSQSSAQDDTNTDIDPIFIESVTHWLVLRQTSDVQDEEYDIAEGGAAALAPAGSEPIHQTPLFHVQGASPDPLHRSQSTLPLRISPEELECAGFNGRCNKVADTCYSFWVGGTLAVLGKIGLLDFSANRHYLLSKAQHLIGGFSKYPGNPPDLLHSYLGLAALSTMREPELKDVDSTLCISVDAKEWLEHGAWKNTRMERAELGAGM